MNRKKAILSICAIAALFFAVKPGAEVFWWRFMDFVNPHGYYESVKIKWAHKSTDFLISKLGHPTANGAVASSILAMRKEPSKEGELIKIIQFSKNPDRRSSALGVLFYWDEKKAIDLSMDILKTGRSHPIYSLALLHLSKRKYEPAYDYALELTRASDKYNNGSAAYLADFGKIESLPILEEMLKNAPDSLYRRIIDRAIQSVKDANQATSRMEAPTN